MLPTGPKSFTAGSVTMKNSSKKQKRVIVFGVFDRLHQGHVSLFEQASRHGDTIVAVVARDEMVRTLKNRLPHEHEETRRSAVEAADQVAMAILGDKEVGVYEVLTEHKPDIICLGYDQTELETDLRRAMREGCIPTIPLIRLMPHEGELYHTSLMERIRNS